MKIAFVSDFDGTITNKDFYWILIDRYFDRDNILPLYEKWQQKEIKDIEFLSYIFGNINQSLETIQKDILSIPIDESALRFIDFFTKEIGDFYILSAGCDFYIKFLLEHLNLKDRVKLISNPSYFENGNIILKPDDKLEYYSGIYGIDKGKAINFIKKEYDFIYFAGDSRPDILASKEANKTFAKSKLIELLQEEKIEFTPFESFIEIDRIIRENL